jgi:hypothetical protein
MTIDTCISLYERGRKMSPIKDIEQWAHEVGFDPYVIIAGHALDVTGGNVESATVLLKGDDVFTYAKDWTADRKREVRKRAEAFLKTLTV